MLIIVGSDIVKIVLESLLAVLVDPKLRVVENTFSTISLAFYITGLLLSSLEPDQPNSVLTVLLVWLILALFLFGFTILVIRWRFERVSAKLVRGIDAIDSTRESELLEFGICQLNEALDSDTYLDHMTFLKFMILNDNLITN